MKHALRIGGRTLTLDLPPGLAADTLEPTAVPAPQPLDPAREANALGENIPLTGKGRCVVVVPDRTRPFPLSASLPALVGALTSRGVAAEQIVVAIASGTHIASEADIATERLGALPREVTLVRHDPAGPALDFGVTPAGTPVRVNAVLFGAQAIACLGSTAFHYFAGFGGGPKMLFPGLGARASIAANHRRALGDEPPGGLAAGVAPGILAGNPVAADLREVHRLLPPAHHLTLWRRGAGESFDGARWSTYEEFVALCARYAEGRQVGEARAYDVVFASAGGAPRDLDVVQSHKALFHAAQYVKDGGVLAFAAAIGEGVGSAALARWLAEAPGDRAALERAARDRYDLNAQTAVSLASIAARVRVHWVAERPEPLLEPWGVHFDSALGDAVREAGTRGARVAIMPFAGEVIPAAPRAGADLEPARRDP